MSYKQMPRLGSAIASTILSLCSAVSLVGVDQAQAAVLTYNFQIENGVGGGSFKVDTSSLTGIGYEEVFVSEGILNTAFSIGNGYYSYSGDTYISRSWEGRLMDFIQIHMQSQGLLLNFIKGIFSD
jgi:hypothetical protein